MIRAGIIGGIMLGSRRVTDDVKMTADTYIAFLKEHLQHWYKRQRSTLIDQ